MLEHSSKVLKRVCRNTLQAESYALTSTVEACGHVRTQLYELQCGAGDVKELNEKAATYGRPLHWITDCRSLNDNLSKPSSAKIDDKRLALDLSGLRQELWMRRGGHPGDPLLTDQRPEAQSATDTLTWVGTAVMLSDALTKFMGTTELRGALSEGVLVLCTGQRGSCGEGKEVILSKGEA